MFIYKIWKEGDENFYIGSTVGFHKRKRDHKITCNNPNCRGHHLKIYSHIRANGGWDSWNIDIIEECETRDRETELIKEMKPSLNMHHRTDRKAYMKKYLKEYGESNKESIKEYLKKYHKDNADKIKEQLGKKCSCECGSGYTFGNRQRHFKSKKHQKYLSLVNI
tara:strand:+ start:37 stop:531 length:495 start_codon:yes stop_codon:yes gene_type:complete